MKPITIPETSGITLDIPAGGLTIDQETLIEAAQKSLLPNQTNPRKINPYDSHSHGSDPSSHLVRQGWNKAFSFRYPEDVYLGIESSIDRSNLPSQFEEIYKRFYDLGFIYNYGNQCILMSVVLKRILTFHGFKAHTKQVICWWTKDEKGQKATVGVSNSPTAVTPNMIDAHMVVSCQGYILDFALTPVNQLYGATAPVALIGIDRESDEYQDFGISGQAAWSDVKPQHPIIKHWRLEQKQSEIDLTKEYFRKYQF